MIRTDRNRFGKTLFILYPGEYFASRDDCLIATVVSACVVVCLHDPVKRIGGMGHFIVPGSIGTEGIMADAIAAHGIVSMEYLIGEIVKLGGDRRSCRATLFGASGPGWGEASMEVLQSNIRFLHEYFHIERIAVTKQDLGGTARRKIFFHPESGSLFRRFLIKNNDHSEFVRLEKEYIAAAFGSADTFGKVLLFD